MFSVEGLGDCRSEGYESHLLRISGGNLTNQHRDQLKLPRCAISRVADNSISQVGAATLEICCPDVATSGSNCADESETLRCVRTQVADNSISHIGAATLASALEKNRDLLTLEIPRNDLGDAGTPFGRA